MHKYLRAIGFTQQPTRQELSNLIEEGMRHPRTRSYTTNEVEEGSLLAQFDLELGRGYGLCVCGQFDGDDKLYPEYVFPYLDSNQVSTTEKMSVDRRIDSYSYSGICDDLRVGVSLIFRLHNFIAYWKEKKQLDDGTLQTSVSLTGLSLDGTILLPIYKTETDRQKMRRTENRRRQLLSAARDGDHDAIDTLNAAEMDVYVNVMNHIPGDDVYSLVDSYLMAYGSECELYTILGEIKKCTLTRNHYTLEEVYVLKISCNGLMIDVAINKKDLYGEPAVGRRFRGTIWMQGRLNIPADAE